MSLFTCAFWVIKRPKKNLLQAFISPQSCVAAQRALRQNLTLPLLTLNINGKPALKKYNFIKLITDKKIFFNLPVSLLISK